MANFNTHISVAFVASGVTALVFYKAGMLTGTEFFLCALTGTVGGLLPDIDLDHAVPAKIGFNVVSLLTAFAMVIYWSGHLSLSELIVTWLLSYLTMRYGVFNVFSTLTVHRGIVHSIPYMLILALGLVYASFHSLGYGAVVSWFFGLFLFFGSMVHLILDELYSVNVFGLSVKKSFGTAFKFFDRQQVGWYIGMYALVLVMLVFAPSFKAFWATITDPMSWLILKNNLLPNALS